MLWLSVSRKPPLGSSSVRNSTERLSRSLRDASANRVAVAGRLPNPTTRAGRIQPGWATHRQQSRTAVAVRASEAATRIVSVRASGARWRRAPMSMPGAASARSRTSPLRWASLGRAPRSGSTGGAVTVTSVCSTVRRLHTTSRVRPRHGSSRRSNPGDARRSGPRRGSPTSRPNLGPTPRLPRTVAATLRSLGPVLRITPGIRRSRVGGRLSPELCRGALAKPSGMNL